MEPFTTHTGTFVCIDRANIDTDAIMPARYLKRIERTGFGQFLFEDLRKKDGQRDPAFPLNDPANRDATVLVARHNFGCGSSREHAVWGIAQAGFKVVVAPRVGGAPGFADIFRQNSYKNGLVPVEVSPGFAEQLFAAGRGEITVDLQAQEITAQLGAAQIRESFAIPDGPREMMLQGLDEIGLTLRCETSIAAFESARQDWIPASA